MSVRPSKTQISWASAQSDQSLTPNLMILEKLLEKNCFIDFSKLALVCSMQISGAWHALHAITEMEWVHSSVTIVTMTFKFIPNISLLYSYQAIKV